MAHFLIFVFCIFFASAEVIQLNNENFEHDTQASTGATTGDWFIKFYAPWCGHCKRLEPAWNQLALELQGQVNVAEVNCDDNSNLASRFGIRGFPTLLFLRHGKVYQYKGARDVESLKAFALGGYADLSPSAVPGESSFFDNLIKEFSTAFKDLIVLWHQRPEAIGLVFSIGLCLGVVGAMFLFVCCIPRQTVVQQQEPEQGEEENEGEEEKEKPEDKKKDD